MSEIISRWLLPQADLRAIMAPSPLGPQSRFILGTTVRTETIQAGVMNEKKLSLVLALSLVILDTTWFTACSRSTKVETSESSQVVSDGNPGSRQSYSHSEERTTETKKEPSSDCSGVLSCAVDTLGSIIAFPFKAVGALVGAIF